MPEVINFTSLKVQMKSYLERGGSATSDPEVYEQIPKLINMAERNISDRLKLLGAKEILHDLVGLTAGQPIITKPDRWRQTASIRFGTGTNNMTLTPLYPRSYEYLRIFWPDQTATDVPEFYADYDYQHWLIAPTPDRTYPMELVAYMQPQLLDQVNQTNFFSIYTPNVLLYGALLEAEPYLQNDARIDVWRDKFNEGLSLLNGQDLQRILDNAVERNKP